jgi:hypothetical protein
MKRILVVLASVIGVLMVIGICALIAISQIPCCAIQPSIYLQTATDQADGTTQILFSTTIDDIQELQAFDANDVLITAIPTAFEEQLNTYFWQVQIPTNTQRIAFVIPQPIPAGIEMQSDVPSWRKIETPNQIGFERALTITLEPVRWEDDQDAAVRLSMTENASGLLHLYDVNDRRIASLDTAFVWDADANRYIWEITLAPEVDRMHLQLNDLRDRSVYVLSMKSGWLEEPTPVGFFRGEQPWVILTSVGEPEGEFTEFRFESTEAVFDSVQLIKIDDTVITTLPATFVPAEGTQGFELRINVPLDTYRIVFVPVQSEFRRIMVTSDVSYWDTITVGDEIGFINSPYP